MSTRSELRKAMRVVADKVIADALHEGALTTWLSETWAGYEAVNEDDWDVVMEMIMEKIRELADSLEPDPASFKAAYELLGERDHHDDT